MTRRLRLRSERIGQEREDRTGTRGSDRNERIGQEREDRTGTRGSDRNERIGQEREDRTGTRGSDRNERIGQEREDRTGTRGSDRNERIGQEREDRTGTRGSDRNVHRARTPKLQMISGYPPGFPLYPRLRSAGDADVVFRRISDRHVAYQPLFFTFPPVVTTAQTWQHYKHIHFFLWF